MFARTDLAIEKGNKDNKSDILKKSQTINGILIDTINEGENIHITCTMPSITFNSDEVIHEKVIAEKLTELLPENKNCILVCGLGNRDITPDAIGPITASRVLATRHISGNIAKELHLESLRSVAAIVPDVLGKTGIEAFEIIKSVANNIKPSGIIVIDALCARDVKRLGTTVQISTAGISPGSGVQNSRQEISKKTLGIPVIALGVPTVTDASALLNSSKPFIVTSRDIDVLIDSASTLLSRAINLALQPDIEPEILTALV